MRKSFVYAAGLMCLALSITDCQKELVDQTTPASEPNFELFARPVTTKTANNDLDTKWVANDDINVFHAEAGSTSYLSDGQFTVKDIETGRFDGTVSTSLSADKSYDWYAFYPYTSQITTPGEKTAGWVTVGGTSQTQTGNGSRAHLAGESCPLYGIASNVASDKVPSIEMNHLTSVIKVSVTNNSGEDLTVSSVSFTGTEDIVGTYYINFAASPVAYKSSGNAYVSPTASLTVANGEALANGSSADFYIALKPFTAKTGSTLKLAVNGYEKTLTLKNDITFTAGHIKTLGFNVDKKIPKKVWTIVTDASTLAAGDKIVIVSNSKKKVAAGIESDYLKETSAQFSSDLSTIESMFADASVFTLGGSANSWTLSNSDGALLGATAAKKLAFNKGTTSWKITISESDDATIQNGNNSYGKILYNVNSTRFSTYTSVTNVSMLLPQIYRLESALPALATPTVDYEIQNLNSIFVMWSQVEGAKDYTVTCGDKTVKVTGDKYTFEGLAYSTEYTISVVANPADASVNAPSAAGTATATTGANPAGTTEKVLIIDAEKLTNTATTKEETYSFDGIDFIFSKGAKAQVSTSATNSFSNNASILIGKSGAYIYNKTAIPGVIKKFEIYANEGASTKVSVGVNFSASSISSYSATAQNTYKATLSTTNKVYDCSDKLPAGAKYFWYQVTNAYNSQVQFRITYVE